MNQDDKTTAVLRAVERMRDAHQVYLTTTNHRSLMAAVDAREAALREAAAAYTAWESK